ncbi:MAG: PilN domain-containing protein [Dissulfurispiraceae bacterium]|jgi:Tfp pilus assembly protein PilN
MEAIRKINLFASETVSALRKVALPLSNALAFSAADERITYKKELCVAVEKSGIAVAYGTRFLSFVSVRGMKFYPSAERVYPQPKDVASSAVLAVNEFGAVGAGITLSIPKTWAVLRTAEFPAVVRKNLSDVIAYEFDQIVPFSPEEAFYDFSITRETPEKITIVLAAVKADTINSYSSALREAGLTVGRVTLNLLSIGALCRSISKKKNFVYIGIDGDDYDGALFLKGGLSGVVNGTFAADDDASRADTITDEIRPLTDIAKKSDAPPRLFALVRGGRSALKERLRTSLAFPVSLLDETDTGLKLPAGKDNIPYTAVGGVIESLLPGTRENRAIFGGTASGMRKLNLLSRGRRRLEKIPMGLSVILLLLITALWVVYFIAPIQVEEKRLTEIERQIKLRKSGVKDIENIKQEIEDLDSEVQKIREFKEGKPPALTILRELTTILPKSVWLTRVRITQSTVEMEGYSSSSSEILSRLETSKYLTKAEFSAPTFRDLRLNADRFNIKAEIRVVKEAKGKEAKTKEAKTKEAKTKETKAKETKAKETKAKETKAKEAITARGKNEKK